jgi:hypothetical protein
MDDSHYWKKSHRQGELPGGETSSRGSERQLRILVQLGNLEIWGAAEAESSENRRVTTSGETLKGLRMSRSVSSLVSEKRVMRCRLRT